MKFNTIFRITATLLAILCLLPCLSLSAFAASSGASSGDEEQKLYVEKYVSVLYDNSGSMRNDDKRAYYSTYAIQMMASMMNSEDKLWITPMNVYNSKYVANDKSNPMYLVSTVDNSKRFEFSANRENDIKSFVDKYMAIDFNASASQCQPLTPLPGAPTPPESIATAVDRVYKYDDIDGYTEGRERKRWAVILTDGAFTNDGVAITKAQVIEYLQAELDEYEDLNMIYISLGNLETAGNKKSDVIDLSTSTEFAKYQERFKAYHCDASSVVSTMREVMNRMSDRYTLGEGESEFISMSADGKTATVNLDLAEFPLYSISYAVQDFGGTVTSATYDGVKFTPTNCKITPPSQLGLQSGVTGTISHDTIRFNTADSASNKLILTFSHPVKKDNIVLMAEPALYMKPVFQYEKDGKWIEASAGELSKKLASGDEIRVGYRIMDGSNDTIYNTETDLPGKTFGTVYLDGTVVKENLKGVAGEPTNTNMSDPISLSTGKNEIRLNVSLMDDVYRLESKVTVEIVGSTEGYELKGELISLGGTKTKSVFTAYRTGTALTAAELSEYAATAVLKNAAGEMVTTLSAKLEGNTFAVELDLADYAYGEYALVLSLEHNRFSVSMAAQTFPSHAPSKIELSIDGGDKGSEIKTTENAFHRGQTKRFTFFLKADNKNLDFDSGIVSYEVIFDGEKLPTSAYTVKGNKLMLLPNAATVGKLMEEGPKDYKITVKAFLKGNEAVKDERDVKLVITESLYEVVCLSNDKLPIDRFNIEDTPAEMYFAVYCDGKPLTEEELAVALGYEEKTEATETVGEITVDCPWARLFIVPVNLSKPEITTYTVNGESVPAFRVVIESGHIFALREVTAMFINGKDKPITVSYTVPGKTVTPVTEYFVLAKASIFSYIIRIIILYLIFNMICYIASEIMGTVRRHRAGYIVTVTLNHGDEFPDISCNAVNVTFKQRFIFRRLFFFRAKQKDFDADSNVLITFNRTDTSGKTKRTKRSSVYYKDTTFVYNVTPGSTMDNFMKNWSMDSSPEANCTFLNVKSSELRSTYRYAVTNGRVGAAGNVFEKDDECTSFNLTHIFGTFSEGRNPVLTSLFFFAPRNK